MRVLTRIALVAVLLISASTLTADHYQADCPLSLVDSTPAATDFDLSPHGVFRSGSTVYVLRGNVLASYTINDLGNLGTPREDYIGSLGARETNGGVAFSNGFLFISSEHGLEIYNLANTRPGGTAPVRVARIAGLHYRRLAVSGNRLVGLYPATDIPCAPSATLCPNQFDVYDITNVASPIFTASINTNTNIYRGQIAFNDIAFNSGYLITVAEGGTSAWDVTSNAVAPQLISFLRDFPGKWLVSSAGNVIGVGNDLVIDMFNVRPGMSPFFQRRSLVSAPMYLTIDKANAIRFHPRAYFDDATARLVTMIEEVDPMTLEPARTIAFDVFDLLVPFYEGSSERIYEDVTMTVDDEVKYNPLMAGPYVYVVGESTGLQSWGACGQVSGRIELESPFWLTCNGAEIHGWVTGVQKIVNVELFLNNTSLGSAQLGSSTPRDDVSSKTPVTTWRVAVNLDATARGEYTLRAIGTDITGNRRQFASKQLFFPGPGSNCTTPRRRSVR